MAAQDSTHHWYCEYTSNATNHTRHDHYTPFRVYRQLLTLKLVYTLVPIFTVGMFSDSNGMEWHMLDNPHVEPYSHAVKYEDGTSHTYTTLERPNCHFNAQGQMTHINLAADMTTQDGGCPSYQVCPAKVGGKCACTNCKYADHAGTIIIALEV